MPIVLQGNRFELEVSCLLLRAVDGVISGPWEMPFRHILQVRGGHCLTKTRGKAAVTIWWGRADVGCRATSPYPPLALQLNMPMALSGAESSIDFGAEAFTTLQLTGSRDCASVILKKVATRP